MADLVSYALTTLADVKESLGIDSGNTSKDNLIKRKINQATHMIESYCALPEDHHFKQTTYTNEEFDATNSRSLVLRMRPVTAITDIGQRSSSENIDNWDSIETDNYFINESSGTVDFLFGLSGRSSAWRVSYTAGYATIPADLAEACVMLASYLVNNASSGGQSIKRKQEGQREIEFFPSGQTGSLIEELGLDDMISKYVRYPIQDDL